MVVWQRMQSQESRAKDKKCGELRKGRQGLDSANLDRGKLQEAGHILSFQLKSSPFHRNVSLASAHLSNRTYMYSSDHFLLPFEL